MPMTLLPPQAVETFVGKKMEEYAHQEDAVLDLLRKVNAAKKMAKLRLESQNLTSQKVRPAPSVAHACCCLLLCAQCCSWVSCASVHSAARQSEAARAARHQGGARARGGWRCSGLRLWLWGWQRERQRRGLCWARIQIEHCLVCRRQVCEARRQRERVEGGGRWRRSRVWVWVWRLGWQRRKKESGRGRVL